MLHAYICGFGLIDEKISFFLYYGLVRTSMCRVPGNYFNDLAKIRYIAAISKPKETSFLLLKFIWLSPKTVDFYKNFKTMCTHICKMVFKNIIQADDRCGFTIIKWKFIEFFVWFFREDPNFHSNLLRMHCSYVGIRCCPRWLVKIVQKLENCSHEIAFRLNIRTGYWIGISQWSFDNSIANEVLWSALVKWRYPNHGL